MADFEQLITTGGGKKLVGKIIEGRLQLTDLVGEGAASYVYRANHKLLGKPVAVKLLKTSLANDPRAVNRFMQETRTASLLNHPNIVKVNAFGVFDDMPYVVMDLLEGETLAQAIEQHKLTPGDALDVVIQICHALECLHKQQFVHRDLKPSNIMLVEENGRRCAKLLDLGIAKNVSMDDINRQQQLTQTGVLIGTPLYMSPEQCAGKPVDQRSDVYSLGCVLFEALTGAPPFVGASALETMFMHTTAPVPQVNFGSTNLASAITTALQKNPEDRFQTIYQFRGVLEEAVGDELHISQPVRTKRKTTVAPKAVLACCLIALSVGLWLAWRTYKAKGVPILSAANAITRLKYVPPHDPALRLDSENSPPAAINRASEACDLSDDSPNPSDRRRYAADALEWCQRALDLCAATDQMHRAEAIAQAAAAYELLGRRQECIDSLLLAAELFQRSQAYSKMLQAKTQAVSMLYQDESTFGKGAQLAYECEKYIPRAQQSEQVFPYLYLSQAATFRHQPHQSEQYLLKAFAAVSQSVAVPQYRALVSGKVACVYLTEKQAKKAQPYIDYFTQNVELGNTDVAVTFADFAMKSYATEHYQLAAAFFKKAIDHAEANPQEVDQQTLASYKQLYAQSLSMHRGNNHKE